MVSHSQPSFAERRAASTARAAALHRWERVRAQGRSHFVWRNGVAGWGLPAAIVTMAYQMIEEQGFVWSTAISADLQHALALIAIAFPALGYFFGAWLWTQGEARYRKMLAEDGE